MLCFVQTLATLASLRSMASEGLLQALWRKCRSFQLFWGQVPRDDGAEGERLPKSLGANPPLISEGCFCMFCSLLPYPSTVLPRIPLQIHVSWQKFRQLGRCGVSEFTTICYSTVVSYHQARRARCVPSSTNAAGPYCWLRFGRRG